MIILERYLYREILTKLGWITGILLLILASHRFVDYLADAAAGDIPGNLVFEMLYMKMLALLPRMLPVAMFIAIILALSRMAQDRELTVVAGAGVAESFKVISILKLSAVYSVFVFAMSFFISPWAEGMVRELRNQAEAESDITGITAGQFREFSRGDRVVYVEELHNESNLMENVFLQVRQDDRISLVNSDISRFLIKPESGSRYVLFEKGARYDGHPGKRNYQITSYRTYAVLLEQGESAAVERRLESLPVAELWGSGLPAYKAELHWRLSYVIASLLLPLFALAMSRFSISESRYVPLFIAILVYLIYSNLLGLAKSLLRRGDVPDFAGLWWVHLLLLGIILILGNFSLMQQKLKKLFIGRAGSGK